MYLYIYIYTMSITLFMFYVKNMYAIKINKKMTTHS